MNTEELIELEVYSYADPNVFVDVLNARMDPAYMEELGGPGGGSVKVSVHDPKIVADPTILDYRNVVKVKVHGVIIGAFLIGKKISKILDKTSGEEVYEITGETLRTWFSDATLKPSNGLSLRSPTTRSFNFSTERGAWYKDSDWKPAIELLQIHTINPANYWSAQWGYGPGEWPDAPTAKWIWGTGEQNPPGGNNYFRYEFSTAEEGEYSLFLAVDNAYTIYLDGAEIANSAKELLTWTKTTRVDFPLTPGEHVLAIAATQYGDTDILSDDSAAGPRGPAGVVAALFRVGDAASSTAASLVGVTDASWKVLSYPAYVPGWTPGDVVLRIFNEAKARGIRFTNWITPTFTALTDSNGQPWESALDWTFDIGDDYTAILDKLEELVCDIWIDPATLTFNMAKSRGWDRSEMILAQDGITPVSDQIIFEEGKNLRRASIEGVGEVKNALTLLTVDGWIETQNDESVAKYGIIEGKLDTNSSSAISRVLASVVYSQRANPEQGATYQIFPHPDAIPFLHYGVGDWVLAPDDRGLLVKRRIVSLSLNEDAAGNPAYTAEFDTIFRDTEDKLNRMLTRGSGGGLGGGFSNGGDSSGNPGNQPQTPGPQAPIIRTPKAPVGLAAESVGSWSPNGAHPTSDVTITWNAVTQNTDGSSTIPDFYEVWGHNMVSDDDAYQNFAVVTGTEATLTGLIPGTEWKFKVKARRGSNNYSGDSVEILHTMVGPTTPMDPPSVPDLSSDIGILIVKWNGLLGTNAPPVHFQYVYAEVAVGASPVFTRMGPVLFREGRTTSVPGLNAGTTYRVRLRAVDGVNIISPPSPEASIKLTGVDLGSLEADVKAAIDAAKAAGDAAQVDADDALASAHTASTDAAGAKTAAQSALDKVMGSITSSLDEYVVSNSSTTVPASNAAWSSDTPDWGEGQFVWRRTKNTRLDGTVIYSSPAVITGAGGETGEDAVLLRVSSTRGTSFKNNAIATVLTVTVFKGSKRITDYSALTLEFGTGAFLEWWWRRMNDATFGVISSADNRLSQSGFALTVSPSDVDEQSVFECRLQTPN